MKCALNSWDIGEEKRLRSELGAKDHVSATQGSLLPLSNFQVRVEIAENVEDIIWVYKVLPLIIWNYLSINFYCMANLLSAVFKWWEDFI